MAGEGYSNRESAQWVVGANATNVLANIGSTVVTDLSSGATNDNVILQTIPTHLRVNIQSLAATITTTVSGGTAIVLQMFRRPAPLASTNQVATAPVSLTIASTAIAGDVWRCIFQPAVVLDPGESFTVTVHTKSTTNGAAILAVMGFVEDWGPISGLLIAKIQTSSIGTINNVTV